MKIVAVTEYTGPVNEDGLVPVYDITVEGTHLYYADGILVANSKRISGLDVNALMAGGNTETLRDAGAIRGQKNEEMWLQFMQGNNPSNVKVPHVYEKFVNHLKASGIHVVREGHQTNIMNLTDKHIKEMAGDRILQHGETVNFGKDLKPIAGGLFDQKLTGGHGGKNWSAYKLEDPMPSPIMEEPIRRVLGLTQKKFEGVIAGTEEIPGFGKGPQALHKALADINLTKAIGQARVQMYSATQSKRDEAVRKLGFLKNAEEKGIHPSEWMLHHVPVLPPAFRPVAMMGSSHIPLVSDANFLYKELHEANKNLGSMKQEVGEDGVGPERLALYHAFKAVTGLGEPITKKSQEKGIKGILKSVFGTSPKFSSVQRKLLSSAVDNVGRSVIVPNPDLDMDSVGLPENQAFEVYKKFLVRRLRRRGMPMTQALEHVTNKSDLARDMLQEEMGERPVFINRAPVLHKFGIMAFKPRLMKGDVMHISPLVVNGFNADFDGDKQYAHVFCFISSKLLTAVTRTCRLTLARLEEHRMTARFKTQVCVETDGDFYAFHLEDFPHGKYLRTTRGQFGDIDWFEVPSGVKVLTVDETGVCRLADVTVWSKHYDCPVQIVTLASGRQIFSDDDPRAVYGIPAGTLKLSRARPSDAVKNRFLVPRLVRLQSLTDSNLKTVPGEMLSCATQGNHLKQPVELTGRFGYVLGVLVGDGWATSNGKDVCVAATCDEIIDRMDRGVSALFDGSSPIRHTEVSFDSYGDSKRHTYASVEFNQLVAPLIGRGAEYKHLPVWFLRSPLPFRTGLFAGLMDTDGSISVSNAQGKKPQLMANYSSRSLRLCQEVRLLAATLSIRGRITTSATPAGEPFWMLSFSNIDISRWGGKWMAHPQKLANVRSLTVEMTPAQARTEMVPISTGLARYMCQAMPTPKDRSLWPKGQDSVYAVLSKATKTGTLSRVTALQVVNYVTLVSLKAHPEWVLWWSIVNNTDVTWDQVESYEATTNAITGYDLTVPGVETFSDIDGVILSNTMQFHAPSSPEAVKEAYARMLPSKNLLSPADFKTAVHAPSHEYAAGIYEASSAKSKRKPRYFASKKDALAAYQRGEIKAEDPVVVMNQ